MMPSWRVSPLPVLHSWPLYTLTGDLPVLPAQAIKILRRTSEGVEHLAAQVLHSLLL